MQVGDVMTQPVVSVGPEASLLNAGELMLSHDISGLPVVDKDNRLIGILTERDFLRPPRRDAAYRRPRWLEIVTGLTGADDGFDHYRDRKVADVMTASPIAVTEEAPLEEAVRLMHDHDINRLPVLKEGRLTGIVARADLLRALVKAIRETSVASQQGEALTTRLTELERQAWLHRTRT